MLRFYNIDIFVDDMYRTTMRYLAPEHSVIDEAEVIRKVEEKYPSLTNKKYSIAFA